MKTFPVCAAVVAASALFGAGAARAAMTPAAHFAPPAVERVDCAVGFHIGPAGACIIGTPEPEHRVIEERRATDDGCETRSVQRSDDMGNTETRTKTNCN